jgi:regulator of replication initiation timing
MNKSFSEMIKDERYDTECTFKTLNKIADELNSLLNENAYLMAENKELKRQLKMYQNSINEGIEESKANIAMALKACLQSTNNTSEEED